MPPAYSLLDGDGRLREAARKRPLVAAASALALLLLLGLLVLSGRTAQPVVRKAATTLDTAYAAQPFSSAKAYSAGPFALTDLFDDGFIASLDSQLQGWAKSREGVVDTVRFDAALHAADCARRSAGCYSTVASSRSVGGRSSMSISGRSSSSTRPGDTSTCWTDRWTTTWRRPLRKCPPSSQYTARFRRREGSCVS